jgi:hypothetical protein
MLSLRADTEMQGRIEEPADECTEGRFTLEERDTTSEALSGSSRTGLLRCDSHDK